MTLEQLMHKHNAYMDWLASKPEWSESDTMQLIKYRDAGLIEYDRDMRIVEVQG